MNNLISVIIPLYNAERYISETLDSVLSQTYPNWECIVVDDGSTDSSADIVKRYSANDSRIRYIKQENGGPSKARNNGFDRAKGDYIQFLDADDVILPERFKTLLKEYKSCDDSVILYSDILLGEDDDIYKRQPFSHSTSTGKDLDFRLIYSCFGQKVLFVPGAILFPRRAVINNRWDETMSYSEDWDLYLRITKSGYSFRNFPTTLFIYRNSDGSLSKNINKILIANYTILFNYSSISNLHIYLYRVTNYLFKNILHIKHKRINYIVKPFIINNRVSALAIFITFFSCLFLPIYMLKLKLKWKRS